MTAPLVRRYLAQSKTSAHSSIMVESRADQLVLEAEAAPGGGRGLAAGQQRLEHAPVELPGPMLVGVGQGGAGRGGDAQVGQLAFAAGQPPADLPQGVRPAELTEQHGHELAPAGEAAGMALGPVLLDQGLKLGAREELEQLAEDAGESLHGWPPLGVGLSTLGGIDRTIPQEVIRHRLPSSANLDKSVVSYTPKHLAEKILTPKSTLEDERKQVTVLFADLKGSMELLADRDPEEARTLLDPVLERMMEAGARGRPQLSGPEPLPRSRPWPVLRTTGPRASWSRSRPHRRGP